MWLTKLYEFITVTWCLYLKTPVLKIKFAILKPHNINIYELFSCTFEKVITNRIQTEGTWLVNCDS